MNLKRMVLSIRYMLVFDQMKRADFLFSDASAMMTGSTFRLTAGEYI